jgi:hypothetical protein
MEYKDFYVDVTLPDGTVKPVLVKVFNYTEAPEVFHIDDKEVGFEVSIEIYERDLTQKKAEALIREDINLIYQMRILIPKAFETKLIFYEGKQIWEFNVLGYSASVRVQQGKYFCSVDTPGRSMSGSAKDFSSAITHIFEFAYGISTAQYSALNLYLNK